jgi:hypothetical protein
VLGTFFTLLAGVSCGAGDAYLFFCLALSFSSSALRKPCFSWPPLQRIPFLSPFASDDEDFLTTLQEAGIFTATDAPNPFSVSFRKLS